MFKRSNYRFAVIYIAIIVLVAITYWPVVHGDFVWDDMLDLHDSSWLRVGDEWKHYIFRGFHYWSNYFRPLGIGLLTLQVRLFNDTPGPMHAVSLAMHLIDTVLVGLLSWICLTKTTGNGNGKIFIATSMLLYGLHPILIEPVAWIGCQFELLLTMLILLGLIANLSVRNIYIRAGSVACLFFLAACAKEAAFSFPLLLFIFDWLLFRRRLGQNTFNNILSVIARNWLVYATTFLAGMAYLAFRYWALGKIINPAVVSSLSAFARMQEVCFLYLHYWKTLIWPMGSIGPIHPVDVQQFAIISPLSLLTDMIAISIVLIGFRLVVSKSSVVGCMLLAVTAALLPVIHIASVDFDSSLYHERYAMTALTATLPMLPLVLLRIQNSGKLSKLGSLVLATAGLFWLIFAFVNIRATLPLWSNNVNLWRWAVAQNPGYAEAENGLLVAYIDSHDYAGAHKLIDTLLLNHVECPSCMISAAFLAIAEHNTAAAASALNQVRDSKQVLVDKKMFAAYLFATGEMLTLQGNLVDAEGALRAVVEMDTLSPEPKIALAMTLALAGKAEEARQVGDAGIEMLPANERSARQKALDQVIESVQSKASIKHSH